MRGHGTRGENGDSANASRTASSAGFGDRSARVRPNSQSSTSCPCRYHSSVQANTNTPAQPAANAVRTCQSSDRAWALSLWRRLSRPSSLMRSGRSPAMFWRREVGLEPVLRLEVHVEADEVEKRQPQVFGGRVVDVGDKPVGVFFLDHPVHPLEVALDCATADVALHRRGYLVAACVAQLLRMP